MKGNFLPITREEMKERGWDQVDFVYVSGDAYVDHPSFGHAIITRLLESRGYRVGTLHSRTGVSRRACRCSENQDLDFLFLQEIWILW